MLANMSHSKFRQIGFASFWRRVAGDAKFAGWARPDVQEQTCLTATASQQSSGHIAFGV